MPVSRTMWLRGIYIDAAKMKSNARDDRDDRVKEISRKWKEGFAVMKAENDRLQKECEATFHQEILSIDAMTKSQIAQGPPTD